MSSPITPVVRSSRSIVSHIADDVLRLSPRGVPDYKRIAGMVNLSKADLGKLGGVSLSSVRFDQSIPLTVAERLREVANIANLVGEFFKGDERKVGRWFEVLNPALGNVSPRTMIRSGRYKRLLSFVLEAREAEAAGSSAIDSQPPAST